MAQGSRFELDRRGVGQFLRSAPVGRGCEVIARGEAAALAARTPRDTGDTAESTSVEGAMFADRRGAWISQAGVAVALEWGNARTRARHHATRGM